MQVSGFNEPILLSYVLCQFQQDTVIITKFAESMTMIQQIRKQDISESNASIVLK